MIPSDRVYTSGHKLPRSTDQRGQRELGAQWMPSAHPRDGRSVLENESDLQLYAEFADLPLVVDKDLLILDPGSFDFLEGLGGPGNTGLDGILETFR